LIVNALMQGIAHLPVATLSAGVGARQIIEGAGWLFAAGIQIALPLLVFVLLLHLTLAMIARTQPGVDMFSTGLGVGALGLLVALVWGVPLIAAGIQQGLVQMQAWLTLGR
jgi:flagellar biosynthetic protein FliR